MVKSPIMATNSAGVTMPSASNMRHWQIFWIMVLATLGYSFMPVAVALFDGEDFPFLFNAAWRGGIALTLAIFLFLFFPRLFLSGGVWLVIFRRMRSWHFVLLTIAYFDIALFAMSINYVDIKISIMLMMFSPIVQIFFLWLWHRSQPDEARRGTHAQTFLFMLVGLIGIVFVILSWVGTRDFLEIVGQVGTAELWYNDAAWTLSIGISLAVVSALIYGLNGHYRVWSGNVKEDLPESLTAGYDNPFLSVDLFCATIAVLMASIAVIPFCLAIGLGGNAIGYGGTVGDVYNRDVLLSVLLLGALVHPVATLTWRTAHIITENLDVAGKKNADINVTTVQQLQPILTLLWLLLLASLVNLDVWGQDVRGDLLIVGIAAIMTAILLINFEAGIRWGFKALLIGLGTFGAAVYLRDGTLLYFGIGTEHWVTNDYLGAVALSATIFTLLLAFRIANLVSRTTAEESHAFNAFRRFDMLARKGLIDSRIRECIVDMDAPGNRAELKDAYTRARKLIIEGEEPTSELDREMLLAAEADLDILARSKQLGLVLGELLALIIFAGLTIAFALLLRPDVQGALTAMLYDLFAMMVSSVVFFLTIHVWDLHHERASRQLEVDEERRDFLVTFPYTEQSTFDLWISVFAGLALVLIYAGLLAHKWLNWFGG